MKLFVLERSFHAQKQRQYASNVFWFWSFKMSLGELVIRRSFMKHKSPTLNILDGSTIFLLIFQQERVICPISCCLCCQPIMFASRSFSLWHLRKILSTICFILPLSEHNGSLFTAMSNNNSANVEKIRKRRHRIICEAIGNCEALSLVSTHWLNHPKELFLYYFNPFHLSCSLMPFALCQGHVSA